MAKRAGGPFYAGGEARAGLLGQGGTGLVVAGEGFLGNKSAPSEDGIERADRVTLAEDEAVSGGIGGVGWIDAQDAPVEGDKEIETGERSREVGAFGLVGKEDEPVADFACDLVEVFFQRNRGLLQVNFLHSLDVEVEWI